MPSRRHFLLSGASLAVCATLLPWLPRDAWAATESLLQRKIPSSGENLPVIGLGTSRVFNVNTDSSDMAALQEVISAFFAGGARLIDTAPSYGAAEQVTGVLLDRAGESKAFLATKLSSTGRERGLEQFKLSQEALKRDKIDLVQVHNLQDTATQLALLRELKQDGLVRYIGITHYVESAHDDLIATLEREKDIDFVQFNYSVGERGAEQRLLPYCADHGLATLINRPFQRAALLSKVKDQPLPDWASELKAGSWAQLLLKFILAQPAVTVAIPATSNPRYMVDNLAAGRDPLPDAALRAKIVAAFA
ncbi:aldo/keto reductase [Pseudomonas sp. UL073]|uniref:Aldo/keto reductase n=1 Tax=Zestomonas insulae TaxID=2809017 RepID=A0ABS2ILP2_9GAMM|nr:aldo/keto reductase [Pseudomonas insulae]MBM7062885.1 aldo/keto reductase [Pseudomonas insulae]